MQNTLRFFTLLLMVVMTGCGSNVPTVKPYKMDIQQGNIVTSEMLLKLRPGMTKSQVQFIMGTPLLVDSFHSNRWDYFYQLRKQGEIINQRRVILDFDGDALARVRGDVVPEGTDIDTLMQQADSESKSSSEKMAQQSKAEAIKTEPVIETVENPSIAAAENDTTKLQAANTEEAGKVEEAAKAEAMRLEAAKAEEVAKAEAIRLEEQSLANEVDAMIAKPKLKIDRVMVPAPPEVKSSSSSIARPTRTKIPPPPMIGKAANSSPAQERSTRSEEDPGLFERTLEMIGF